jgi:hypothetical protein
MCDVVSMHASHLLLGCPSQFDLKAFHDGFSNRFTIVKDDKTTTLVSFGFTGRYTRKINLSFVSPKQVYDYQMRLKRDCEDGKSENSCEDNGERRPSDSAKSKSLIKSVERGGKTQGVK